MKAKTKFETKKQKISIKKAAEEIFIQKEENKLGDLQSKF